MSATNTFLILTAIYVLVLVYIGWRGYKSTSDDLGDFFVAKGHIGTFVLFWTLFATSWSAFTFLGMTGITYSLGLGWIVMIPATGAFGLMVYLLGPRVHEWGQRFNYVTPSDLFQDRFNSRQLGLLIAVIGLLGVVPYAAIQITGIGLAFEGITGGEIPFLGGTLFFLLFLAVYTIFGGFRAVAWTDTIQGVIFFVFLWIALSQVFESPEIGGLSAVFSELAARSPSPLEVEGQVGYMGYVTWISWFLLIIPGMVAYPWIIQRFFAAKSKTVIYKAAAMIPILALLTMIPPIVIGLTAIVAMPDLQSADTAMVSMLTTHAGVLLGSILGLGAIAAAMSTIDSILLSMGSIVTRDIISPNFAHLSKAQLMKWARISIGAWVVLCLAIAVWRPTLIVLLGSYDLQFIGLGLFVPLVAALFWSRATAAGIISGVVLGEAAGIVAAFIWKNPFGFGLDPVIWGYIVEVPVLIVVSLLSKPLAADHVGRFFKATASDA